MDNELIKKLINAAKEAMQNSYAPYSNFRVGAALLCEDGSIYKGCNIENSSYGATICAERSAACAAVSNGHRKYTAIAIISDAKVPTMPCGVCRQFLIEFGDIDVICAASDEKNYKVYKLSELLAHSFDLKEILL